MRRAFPTQQKSTLTSSAFYCSLDQELKKTIARLDLMEQQLYKARFLRKPDSNKENEQPRITELANTRQLINTQHAERVSNTVNDEMSAPPRTLFNKRLLTVRDARAKDHDRIFKLTSSLNTRHQDNQQDQAPLKEEPKLEQNKNNLDIHDKRVASSDSPTRRRVASRFRASHMEEHSRPHSSSEHDLLNSLNIRDAVLGRPEINGTQHSLVPKDSSFTLRALELDNLFIRQCIQDLEVRIAAQEEIQHELFPNQSSKLREIEVGELKARQQWLEKAAEAPSEPETVQQKENIDNSLQRIARRIEFLEKGFDWKTRLESLTVQDILKTIHRVATNPIFLLLASCLLVVLALYIHMIYFDDDERQLRNKLGPELYRTGWMEYSMRVF